MVNTSILTANRSWSIREYYKNIGPLSTKKNPPKTEYFIRWGYFGDIDTGSKEVLNSKKAISLASSKKRARQKMIEEGVPCPKLTKDEFPMLARPIRHKKGEKFFIIKHALEIMSLPEDDYYYQKYLEKVNEYRVHVFFNKVIAVQKKQGEFEKFECWNHKNGFIFEVTPWSKIPRGICKVGVDAIKAIELSFGAVDIIEDKEGNFYVLEINTAPGVCDYMGNKYTEIFKFLIKKNFEVKEFPFKGKYIIREGDLT